MRLIKNNKKDLLKPHLVKKKKKVACRKTTLQNLYIIIFNFQSTVLIIKYQILINFQDFNPLDTSLIT